MRPEPHLLVTDVDVPQVAQIALHAEGSSNILDCSPATTPKENSHIVTAMPFAFTEHSSVTIHIPDKV